MKVLDGRIHFRVLFLIGAMFCGLAGLSSAEDADAPSQTFPDAELDALEEKLKTDPQYMWELTANWKEMLPVVLAAVKRSPETSACIPVIGMFFASDQFDARELPPEQRRARYKEALGYLNQCAEAIEAASPDANPFMKERAFASLEAGKLTAAKDLAEEALKNDTNTSSWDYGNVIHWANTVLGRAALREDDLDGAKKYLLESGETPGSPQLNSFGPSFVLARELLEKSETSTVLEYMDLVAEFWASPAKAKPSNPLAVRNAQDHARKLEAWKREIEEGKVPQDRKWR